MRSKIGLLWAHSTGKFENVVIDIADQLKGAGITVTKSDGGYYVESVERVDMHKCELATGRFCTYGWGLTTKDIFFELKLEELSPCLADPGLLHRGDHVEIDGVFLEVWDGVSEPVMQKPSEKMIRSIKNNGFEVYCDNGTYFLNNICEADMPKLSVAAGHLVDPLHNLFGEVPSLFFRGTRLPKPIDEPLGIIGNMEPGALRDYWGSVYEIRLANENYVWEHQHQ